MILLLLPGLYILTAMIWQPLLARFEQGVIVPFMATVLGVGMSLVLVSIRAGESVTLIRWSPTQTFGGDLILHADPLTGLFVALLALIALTSLISERPGAIQDNPTVVTAGLLLTGAAIAFVLAGNLLTLTLSWLLMDLATLATVGFLRSSDPLPVRVQALALNYIGGLLVFMAGIVSLGQRAGLAGLVWTPDVAADLSATFLTIAALLRLGVYPFHRNIPDAGVTPLAVWLRLTPLAAGAYLLARATSLAGGAPVEGGWWVLVTGLSTLIAAILAWLAPTRDDALRWLAVYTASSLLLSLAPGQAEITILVILGGGAFVLAISALFLSEPLDRRPLAQPARRWVRVIRLLAILTLWGFPFTLGFVFRWGVYQADLEGNTLPALIWSAVAAAFAAAPLWALTLAMFRRRPTHSDESEPLQAPIAPLVGLTLIGLPLLFLGVQPQLLTPILDAASGTDARVLLTELGPGRPASFGLPITLALLTPWLVGLGLSRLRALTPANSTLIDAVRSRLALDWLYRRRWRPVSFAYQLFRYGTSLGEGERYVGLLAVFGMIVALALLIQS